MRSIFLYLLGVLCLASCDYFNLRQEHDPILAEAGGCTLHLSDVKGLVPSGTVAADSVALLKQYVDGWVRKVLMAAEAEKQLDKITRDVSREVEDYRRSLLVYRYEQFCLEKELDTVVTEDDLQAFYKQDTLSFSRHDLQEPALEELRETCYPVIMSQRRRELLDKIENTVYKKAVDEQRLKIYVQ